MSGTVVTRRTALRILGAGAGSVAVLPWLSEEGVAAFAEIQRTKAAPSLKVLSASQYATLAALTEAIIPADDRSPGAKEARVADYVDLILSEGDDKLRKEWLDGLAALDADAAARFGASFVKLDSAQVEAMLTEVSRNEKVREPKPREEPSQKERPADVAAAEKPADAALNAPTAPQQKTAVEKFFITAKEATIHGYYTSEIGIHKELRYKGNQLLAEFVGCQTVDGKDCPHCGQKAQA
jgi:Gluconate 2-dehydrogenase subunit 3